MYSATASTPDVTGFLPGQCLNDAALTYMLYRLWWTLTQIDASRAQRMAVFDTFAIKNFLGTAGNNGVLPDDYIITRGVILLLLVLSLIRGLRHISSAKSYYSLYIEAST